MPRLAFDRHGAIASADAMIRVWEQV